MALPSKLTFPKGTKLVIKPAGTKTVPVPEESIVLTDGSLTFSAGDQWIDDPIGQTLTCILKGRPRIVIMGTDSKTPYNPAWQDADARAALYAQLGATVDANGNGSVAAAPSP